MLDHPWFKETPLTRPLLSIEDNDPLTKLKSHMLSLKPDDDEDKINDKIKSVLNKKRESFISLNTDTSLVSSTSNMTIKNNKIHLIASQSKNSSTSNI